mmetsp:Transcript_23608/g.54020  ORF Transcript_23608/g.54020 Transcript_23608/m.54020 type:complete len:242 (-) Transcript_23608:212-937(-)
MDSRPPSRLREITSFSSHERLIGSCLPPTAVDAGVGSDFPGVTPGKNSPSSTIACSKLALGGPLSFPSCMPPSPFLGFNGAGAVDAPNEPRPPRLEPPIPPVSMGSCPSEMFPRAMSSARSRTAPIPPPPMPLARLSFVISRTLRFISSCASRSLDCLIIVASFSSCDSISMFTWISRSDTFSLWPSAIISSNAKTSSKAFLQTLASSISTGQYSLSTFVKSRRVSRSSTIFDCLFVMMSR